MVQWINGGWLIFRWCYTTWFIGDDYSQWQEYLSESISLTGWERCIFMTHMARWNKTPPFFFFGGDSDSKLLTHSWRGISVSMEDLLFLFFYLSYLSIFYPVDGPAKSSSNLRWLKKTQQNNGMFTINWWFGFRWPIHTGWAPPVMFVGL